MNILPFLPPENKKYAAAIFMSGSGTNAEKILELQQKSPSAHYRVAVLITDAPQKSRARQLAAGYGVPLIEHDIRAFYAAHGLNSISLATDSGRRLREEWTGELRHRITPFQVDFGILAGFVPLSNITGDFPCLNVHPADLTVEDDTGHRIFAGLHTVPMENALCMGMPLLRSSVIIAQSFSGNGGKEMDSGPLLGVSAGVVPRLDGYTPAELCAVRAARTAPGRHNDVLARLAAENLEMLKVNGDHVVFPPAIEAFAAGKYARDTDGKLLFDAGTGFAPVRTVEYGENWFKIREM